jgi:formylmethanofuran dehydrogenase subunit B
MDKNTAVQSAAEAVQAHIDAPDSVTFHNMQRAVQDAQNLGASLTDIRDARPTA